VRGHPVPVPIPVPDTEAPVPDFDHERLDVYQAAIEFVATAHALGQRFPPGYGDLADQLRRAAISIPLNVAEGAGEFSAREKARFYRMGLRSATECAAILDVLRVMRIADESELGAGRELLLRIVSMLTRMTATRPGTGTGTGTGTMR